MPLHCTALERNCGGTTQYFEAHCIALHCIAMHCIALHCIEPFLRVIVSKKKGHMSIKQQVSARLIRIGWACAVSLSVGGCVQPPVVSTVPPNPLSNTPDLSAYTRFELFSQASAATGQSQTSGLLAYSPKSSQFDVTDETKAVVGRLHIQPEVCRDDSSPECQRRFTITGRIQVLGSSMSCTVPVRNDVALGYAQQTLSGICQNQYGRSFTFSIYAK
jgi:hypothetical protein